MTLLPYLLGLLVFSASVEVRSYCAHPRGLLPGMDSLGQPEAAEPEGRLQGGGPPHFLRLPGGGAISARWAPKSRTLGPRGRTGRV